MYASDSAWPQLSGYIDIDRDEKWLSRDNYYNSKAHSNGQLRHHTARMNEFSLPVSNIQYGISLLLFSLSRSKSDRIADLYADAQQSETDLSDQTETQGAYLFAIR